MMEIKSGLKSVTDGEKWAARGASFVAKAKATKVVWFPPKPAASGKKTAATAKKATKKTAATAKSATRKTTAAAKKPPSSAKKLTNPARRNKA